MFFFIVLGQHVSIVIESSSGSSKKIDPYLEMLKCAVGSQTLTCLIKLCIKCTCRCFLSVQSGYLFIKLYNLLYILLLIANMYISFKKLKTLRTMQ